LTLRISYRDLAEESAAVTIEEFDFAAQPGDIVRVPDYTLHHLRLQCLQMALQTPDGAAPPPPIVVIERAELYWRFISGTDETAEDPRLNTR
jgi:hypothetical protein